MSRQSFSAGNCQSAIENALRLLEEKQAIKRLWAKDATLWKTEEAHTKIISNALGWTTVARMMKECVGELNAFAKEICDAGFNHVMLLGMGGSSLCPEVFRRTFGKQEGFPELLVLDTTDPDTIADFESRIELEKTLFIVASKSGTTIEPLSFYKYFFHRVKSVKENAGENFVAITDPGTLMQRMATEDKFRKIFLNPSDIGGRYSALSYFGMLPAALMGLNVDELLSRALKMMEVCSSENENFGLNLGAVMGACALEGRDKLTLVTDEKIASLGLWIEQLVAESTGKEGKGVVPIAGEDLADASSYGDDRVFVGIHIGAADVYANERLTALSEKGFPVFHHVLKDEYDLCAEFFVWEIATAISGALLEINPFDQPNVQESKDATVALLNEFKQNSTLPEQEATITENDFKLFGWTTNLPNAETMSLNLCLKTFLQQIKAGDYIALLAYIQETDEHDQLLHSIRLKLRERFNVATTTGYGPRFLHSTGQLHKGGGDNGVFIQLTDTDATDLSIPNEPYGFSILKQSQALGDFSSLKKKERNRRAVRFHLGKNASAGLKKLLGLI
jgi:glucose-6-phosphate isomerase